MLTTISSNDVTIEEVHALRQGILKSSSWQLRAAIARWIGASQFRAAIFFGDFKHALFHRGNFFIARRENEIVGAAYLKMAKAMLYDCEAVDTDWAVLYGFGADDHAALESILVRTLDESVKHGVKTLYLGEKLRGQPARMLMVMSAFDSYLKRRGQHLKDFILSTEPSPSELSFLR